MPTEAPPLFLDKINNEELVPTPVRRSKNTGLKSKFKHIHELGYPYIETRGQRVDSLLLARHAVSLILPTLPTTLSLTLLTRIREIHGAETGRGCEKRNRISTVRQPMV